MKTYAGGQGYVYQYYFVGKRTALSEAAVAEYIFDVSSDRKVTFSVSIFLPEEALQIWASTHGRALTEGEQYAAVKMRLFRAFDEIEDMMGEGRQLRIARDEIGSLLSTLGVQ
jgi:hypothetical protein